jgi:hypothetical protein
MKRNKDEPIVNHNYVEKIPGLPRLDNTLKLEARNQNPNRKGQRPSILKYQGPLHLTDQVVYELSTVGTSIHEIGLLFNIDPDRIDELHRDAFHQGKMNMKVKPRFAAIRLVAELERQVDLEFDRVEEEQAMGLPSKPDTALIETYLKALKLCDRYTPKDITVHIEESPLKKLSTEELKEMAIKLLNKELKEEARFGGQNDPNAT